MTGAVILEQKQYTYKPLTSNPPIKGAIEMPCKHRGVSPLTLRQPFIPWFIQNIAASKCWNMLTLLWGGQAKKKENCTFACSSSFNIQIRFFHFYIIKYWSVRPIKTSHCEIMSATHKEESISVRKTSHSWGVWTRSLPPLSPLQSCTL